MSDYEPFADDQNVEARKEAERLRKRNLNDIRKMLSLAEGRRFLWRVLSETGVFRSSFTQNANQTSFNEGRRDIGLQLLSDINSADSSAFARMQNEFVSEQKSKEKE